MHLSEMLEDTILESGRVLSISIPISDDIDVTKQKEILIEEAERQLQRLSDISHSNILLRKYVYEIKAVYKVSNIVLIQRVDVDTTDNLKDTQFIVNNNKRRY